MEKKSQYKGFTPAQAKAHKKYMADFVELRARVTYAERDSIQAHAAARGESVNGFIKRAIQETMERDKTSRRLGLNPVSGERLEQDSTRPK